VHKAWRLVGALLEHASGISTRTWQLVQAARKVNPKIAVLTTRKMFPGAKRISIKAILAGGALPHRLGLSETILVFSEHVRFMGGLQAFLDQLDDLKIKASEKSIALEVHNLDDALMAARAGVDQLQMDKMPVDKATETVRRIREAAPHVKIAFAGGINAENGAAYASTGADMLVTTWPYFGKPADIAAELGEPKRS
jgi:molybdenum transport protein